MELANVLPVATVNNTVTIITAKRLIEFFFILIAFDGLKMVLGQMHPDALCVRTQLYHSAKKIVTLFSEIFFEKRKKWRPGSARQLMCVQENRGADYAGFLCF